MLSYVSTCTLTDHPIFC